MQFGFMPGRGAQLMQYSSSDIYKKNMWLRTRNFTALLLTLKRHLIEYQEKSFGGPCKNLALRNGFCSLYRLCTTTLEVKLTVDNTYSDEFGVKVLKLELIRVQYVGILDSVSNDSFFEKNKILINHILLIFKLYVYKSREKKFINLNNLIAEIRKIKRIEKEIALNNATKTTAFRKKWHLTDNIISIT